MVDFKRGHGPEVGFTIKETEQQERERLRDETQQLMLLLAGFLMVVVCGVLLLKEGALYKFRLEPKAAGIALSKEAKAGAPELGRIDNNRRLFSKEQSGEWFRVEAEVEFQGEGRDGVTALLKEERGGWIRASEVKQSPAGPRAAIEARRATFQKIWGVAAFCFVIGLIAPSAMIWFHKLWMTLLVAPLAYVNTRILLTIIFYLFLVPVALLQRLTGEDPLARQLDSSAPSYWNPRKELDSQHFEHSF